MRRSVENNVRLYPAFTAARNLMFWVPVFFIYFSEHLSVQQVLWLEALYYFTNVLLEVPSGYFSDRFGRRRTLIAAGVAFVSGYVILTLGGDFLAFAVGQVLVAAGFALTSGTDTALLFDSLTELGRPQEITDREAKAWTAGFGAAAVAAIVGGASASLNLRLGYGLTAISAGVCLAFVFLFVEPQRVQSASATSKHLRDTVRHLRNPILLWVFVFAVFMRVYAHIPYMFFQPYLELLFGDAAETAKTPLVSGALVACMTLLSAFASSRAARAGRRFGTALTLLASLALYVIVCGAMALWLHPLVLFAVAFRSVPFAIADPVMAGAIHPRVAGNVRATYFSVQNLTGSLAFSAVLAVSAFAVGPIDELEFDGMALLMEVYAVAAAGLVLVLAMTSRMVHHIDDVDAV